MILPAKRAAHLVVLATNLACCASLPHTLIAHDALFQGMVVGQRAAKLPSDNTKDALFQGEVIDDEPPGRGVLSGTAERGLGLALPVAGSLPRDVHRSRTDNQPAPPRIGISIGIGVGGSSRSGARKPAPLGPRR